ncbi:DUF6892 domain-containing protein [Umezawaea beigongshangensis]|uniref:DUF6892 domain-containing protein n=1 Tax=Umezawaea beigongshangensis TaxID=2780383 RepID=UPI0018F22F71|nr:hypothetical protein [Umezawaea beigongshangensis]
MEFHDLAAKLLVLDQLCHQLRLLPPYDGPGLPDDRHDATAIDEAARSYYRDLHVPDELLARVTTVLFDGGNSVYQDVAPLWDGEDDLFDVRDWREIAALPALEVVSAAGPLDPAARRLLRERGVVVDDGSDRSAVTRGFLRDVGDLKVRMSAESRHAALLDGLVEAFAPLPVDAVTSGVPVQLGCGLFRIVPEEHGGRAEWVAQAPDYFRDLRGAPLSWQRSLSQSLRIVDAQRQLAEEVLGDGAPSGPAPSFTDGVDVEPGAERAREVHLRRSPPTPGRSGWCLRPGRPDGSGAAPNPTTYPLAHLLRIRPGAVPALALPPGTTVVLDVDEVLSITTL